MEKKTKLEQGTINRRHYSFYVHTLRPYAKIRYGLSIDNSKIKGMKAPFLVLGNHTAWDDVFYFCGCVYPRPLNAVISSNIYYRKPLGKIFTALGTIPKKQFTSDYSCIKNIKKNLDNGNCVLLFPEGRITVDGTTGYIPPSIGKLIKFLKVPVVNGITVGSYVTRPKWAVEKRPNKVKLTLEPMLTVEEIEKLKPQEIDDIIKEKFKYNDNLSYEQMGWKIPGKHIAENLEKLLYKCPNCGAEFKNVSKWDTMTCTECGNTIIYNRNATISGKTEKDKFYKYINEWYSFERDEVRKEVEKEGFSITKPVTLLKNSDELETFVESGRGTITINSLGLTYNGQDGEETIEKFFKLSTMPTVAYKLAHNIEIAEEDTIYRFELDEGMFSAKAVLIIEELYKIYCK